MKNKLTQKNAIDAVVMVGGGVAGAAVGNGLLGAFHEDKQDGNTDLMKVGKRVGLIAAGVMAVMVSDSSSVVGKLVKGAGAGLAISQASGIITDFAKTNETVKSAVDGNKFLSAAVGLGCGCSDTVSLNAPRKARRSKLRSPFVPTEMPVAQPSKNLMVANNIKSFDQIFAEARA